MNGKPAKPHAALEDGDVVTLADDSETLKEKKVADNMKARPDLPLAVVHEDADVIVVDKRSGMSVHPAIAGENDTLSNALLARYPEIAAVGDAPERPGIVHRLDKEASGLMVVARSQKAFDDLKSQFQRHEVEKEYLLLLEGTTPDDSGTITLAVGRSAKGGKMAARHSRQQESDRDAVTHYRVIERLGKATYVSARTETGRTHQLRVHFNAIGCPVAGDPLYGGKLHRIASPRMFLHSTRLAFKHPATGKEMEFTSPLPEELRKVLDEVK